MAELNRDKLQETIQHLPVHKAGDFVWEEIRWQLDKPLVAEFPLHSAPDSIWQGIIATQGISNRYGYIRVSIIAAFLLLVATFIYYPTRVSYTDDQVARPKPGKDYSAIAAVESTDQQKQNVKYNLPSAIQGKKTGLSNQSVSSGRNADVEMQSLITSIESTIEDNYERVQNQVYMQTIRNVSPQSDPELMEMSFNRKPYDCSTFREVNTSFLLIADYNPEIFGNETVNSPSHNFSLSSGYQYNRLRICIGAGLTRLNSTLQMNYQYRTNELIYSYEYVDSVYYDPDTHQTHYFTVTVDVYDSIDHSRNERIYDRYSYFQIPFSLSYEIGKIRKLALNIQASGAYHILQSDYRHYKPFVEANSRILSTTPENKKIASDFWSAGLGITLEYKICNRTGIYITPHFSHNFLNSKDTGSDGINSYGINFGLFYKLSGN